MHAAAFIFWARGVEPARREPELSLELASTRAVRGGRTIQSPCSFTVQQQRPNVQTPDPAGCVDRAARLGGFVPNRPQV